MKRILKRNSCTHTHSEITLKTKTTSVLFVTVYHSSVTSAIQHYCKRLPKNMISQCARNKRRYVFVMCEARYAGESFFGFWRCLILDWVPPLGFWSKSSLDVLTNISAYMEPQGSCFHSHWGAHRYINPSCHINHCCYVTQLPWYSIVNHTHTKKTKNDNVNFTFSTKINSYIYSSYHG